jgi:hypothetical protein
VGAKAAIVCRSRGVVRAIVWRFVVSLHWTEADFDSMSWHDVHVHGLRIVEGQDGAGELSFDLDYILEWLCSGDKTCRFRVAAAILTFRDVIDLRLSLDYATPTAAVTPFSIGGIEREASAYAYQWRIPVNWPAGEITFTSPGFSQRLVGPIIETLSQCLDPSVRLGCTP